MTELDWLTGTTRPADMLRYAVRRVKRRKLILIGCGCCRLVWDYLGPSERATVESVERMTDHGDATPPGPIQPISDSLDTETGVTVASAARIVVWAATHADLYGGLDRAVGWVQHVAASTVGPGEVRTALERCRADLCELFREILGNPYRPWQLWPESAGQRLVQPDGRVIRLSSPLCEFAQVIRVKRAFDQLPFLADAAEDCGVTDRDILEHLRGSSRHRLGCWAVDLLAGQGIITHNNTSTHER